MSLYFRFAKTVFCPLRKDIKVLSFLLLFFSDPEFIESHHFLWRFVYSYISILAIRMRYYFAFKMGKKLYFLNSFGFSLVYSSVLFSQESLSNCTLRSSSFLFSVSPIVKVIPFNCIAHPFCASFIA